MVQEPDEAKYDGMPRAAIQTGTVDFVLPVQDMPLHLIEYFQRIKAGENVRTRTIDNRNLSKIHAVLRNKSGHDFSHYKESTIRRRINRRLNVHGYNNPSEYLRHLQRHPEEIKALVKEMLIGVTQFFRDPEAFQALKETVLPKLLNNRADQGTVRAWVTGCATGEEAYSLAIILSEYIDEHQLDMDYQIFATDLDEDAIEIARTGVYAGDIARDVNPERLKTFFQKQDHDYRIRTGIREKIVFAPQSVIKDPPFTRLDMLLCRNLLIYLDFEIQKKLIPLFHYSLNPGGILFLGHSETIGGFEDYFDILDPHWKIYQRKKDFQEARRPLDFPPSVSKNLERSIRTIQPVSISELVERTLLDQFTPPAIIIDKQGEIRYIHGRVHKFLEHAQGPVSSYNAFEMARENLKMHLISVLHRMRPDAPPSRRVIGIRQNGDILDVRITVSPIREEQGQGLYVVMFEEEVKDPITAQRTDSPPENQGDQSSEMADLRNKLLVSEEKLRTTVEELESTNEELRSSNEEYQSTNEELQSANEELNSSREELQSLNEELETVNSELQGKMQQVEDAYGEMTKMLNSLNMPVIFLDKNLCIKRFSAHAHDIMEMIDTDIGRPVKQLHSKVVGVDLEEEAHKVLLNESARELEIKTKQGKWYLMRTLPFPDARRNVQGVVLAFVDINELKEITGRYTDLAKEWRYAQGIVDTVREPLVALDRDLKVISASRAFYDTFQVKPGETEGQSLFSLGNGQWDIPELHNLLNEILPEKKVFNDFVVEHDFPDIGRKEMLLNARSMYIDGEDHGCILLAIQDATPMDGQ